MATAADGVTDGRGGEDAGGAVFPVERWPWTGTAEAVHAIRFVDFTVGDDVLKLLTVANLLGRVSIDLAYNQVSQLAWFDGANVTVEPQVLGSVERSTSQRLHRRHSALHETPHFPMRS